LSAPDVLRDLLSTATARVCWEVDLDQLPVTCAHTPHLVIALIDAAAAHLAALTAHTALTEAAASIQTVITNSGPNRIDWFAAGLLGTVAQLEDKRVPHLGHTRRALLSALRDLQPEGAAWLHHPDRGEVPGTHTVIYPGLRQCLAALGLHRMPTADPAMVYAADLDEHKVTVTFHPDDGYRTQLDVVGHDLTPWSVTFSPDTPNAVIVAAVRHAIRAPKPPLTPTA
jgi:hypothetical protein